MLKYAIPSRYHHKRASIVNWARVIPAFIGAASVLCAFAVGYQVGLLK